MNDLFSNSEQSRRTARRSAPLAERMRPHSLQEFVGQRHLLAEGCVLCTMLERGTLASSLLLFGAFAACALHWLRRARWEALVFLLPALYGYAVYVMVSHMWVRFAVPLLPSLCVCLALVAWAVLRRLLRVA